MLNNINNNFKANIMQIFAAVLQDILPTPLEIEKIKDIVERTVRLIREHPIPQSIKIRFIEPQGSTGIKNTALHNSSDVDLFIGIDPEFLFSQQYLSKSKRQEYLRASFKTLNENWLIPLLKTGGYEQISLSYAEHPYVSAKFQDIELDLVICFDITKEFLQKNGPITAVDRSPHHSRFIRDNLTSQQRDDVCLFKHFLKCQYSYGDKCPVGRSGFIGYAVEILMIYYHDLYTLFQHFDDLANEVIDLSIRSINDPQKKRSKYQIIQEQFPNDSLFIIDPTDMHRNVASSISIESFKWIRHQIHAFLKNPHIEYFQKKSLPLISSLNLSPSQLECYYVIEYTQVSEDHYTKFRDKCYSLIAHFKKNASHELTNERRFSHVEGSLLFDTDKRVFCIALHTDTPVISQTFPRKGPKHNEGVHYSKFLKVHPDAIEKNGFLWIEVKRSHFRFIDLILTFFQENQIEGLNLKHIYSALDPSLSNIASQSISNLHLHILPFIDYDDST